MSFILATPIFAQNKNIPPKTPTAPTVPNGSSTMTPVTPIAPIAPIGSSMQMPSMPSFSAPVSGSNFYTPGKHYLQDQDALENENKEEKTPQKSTTNATLEKISDSLLGNVTGLSAWDLNQLAQRGALGSISSLNVLNGKSRLSNFTGEESAAEQQKVLQKILKELNQIKEAQKNLSAAPSAAMPSQLPPKILRFVINSRLVECLQVYFSQQENDGSFLLTGDVRTQIGNETLNETFYLLFTSEGTKNSRLSYIVTPTLLQSKPIPSALQQFCSAPQLKAMRTGNLVTLNFSGEGCTADLLLDIGQHNINK